MVLGFFVSFFFFFRYICQRLLRNKIFTSLEGNVDVADDHTRYVMLGPFFSKEMLMNLLETDVVGGVVTAKMKHIISASGSRGTGQKNVAPPPTKSPLRQTAKYRTATVMTNFSIDEVKKTKKGGEEDDEDLSSEEER